MTLTAMIAPIVLAQADRVFPVATERAGRVFVIERAGAPALEIGVGKLPIVDPYGRKVAFIITDADGNENIAVAQIRNPKEVVTPEAVPGGQVFQPAWSPDGTSVTFEHRFPEEGRTLYLWKTREPKAIGVFNVTDESNVQMSPTFVGNDVAFLWNKQLVTLNTSDGSLDRKPFSDLTQGLPNGTTVTYIAGVRGVPGDFVYSVITDSGVAAIFRHSYGKDETVRLSPVGLKANNPILSPDPRRIMFWAEDEKGEVWLYSVNVNGQDLSKVLKKEGSLS